MAAIPCVALRCAVMDSKGAYIYGLVTGVCLGAIFMLVLGWMH